MAQTGRGGSWPPVRGALRRADNLAPPADLAPLDLSFETTPDREGGQTPRGPGSTDVPGQWARPGEASSVWNTRGVAPRGTLPPRREAPRAPPRRPRDSGLGASEHRDHLCSLNGRHASSWGQQGRSTPGIYAFPGVGTKCSSQPRA